MGIAMDAGKWWAVRRRDMNMAFMPAPSSSPAQYTAKQCSHDGVKAGAKAAAIACIASAIPMLIGVRARANLNYAAQAHIISLASGAAYFVVADRTILASARKNSFQKLAVQVEPSFQMRGGNSECI